MMKIFKNQWKKILSVVCALALLVEAIAVSPSIFAQAATPDELESVKATIQATEYSALYAQAENETVAQATALAKVQAVVDAEGIEATAAITGTPELTLSFRGGSYTFNVTVTSGENSVTATGLTMSIEKCPQPVKVMFDSQEVVEKAGFYDNAFGSISKTFVQEDDKRYLHIEGTTNNWGSQTTYTTFLTNSGAGQLDLDAYPYMKISYRRNVPYASTIEYTEVQAFKNDGTNTWTDWQLYRMTGEEPPYWQSMLVDMRDKVAHLTNEDGTTSEKQPYGTAREWSGKTYAYGENYSYGLGITFMRDGLPNETRWMDVEYIAFFASKEQAEAFPTDITSDVALDMQAIATANENGTFRCNAGEASNETRAKEKLNEMLAALELSSEYTIETLEYKSATEETEGTYTAKIVFDEDHISTVTLYIEKMVGPVILSFNSATMASRFDGWNANTTYEDGYVKLTRGPYPDSGDGYQLSGNLNDDEKFSIQDLPYLKIKYKISGASSTAKQQIYLWNEPSEQGSSNCYEFYSHTNISDNDELEVILNMSATSMSEEAVWIKNLTQNTKSSPQLIDLSKNASSELDISSIRYNLSRMFSNVDSPTAYVEYIGFFPTKEEAEAFEGTAQQGLNAAKEYLQNNPVRLMWSHGNTEEKALKNLGPKVEACGVGAVISNAHYTAPTEEKDGTIVYDVTLTNAGKTATVAGLTAYIAKKPDEPIMWRFNNQDIIDKLNPASAKLSLENYRLKMVGTDPIGDDGFYFLVDTADMGEQFYLEDYPFVQVKYKRNGAAPIQVYFYSDAYTGDPELGGNLGFGAWNDYWYTSTIDTTRANPEVSTEDYLSQPTVYNYNHDKGEYENYYPKKMIGKQGKEFKGLSTSFRFNFGRRKYIDRTAEIEYIAFFPTLEDALDYQNNKAETERLIANAQVALQSYNGSPVKYYDGSTKDDAIETAEELLASVVGSEVSVKINDATYTKPELNSKDGSLVFTADICDKNGSVLFTTEQYTMTISKTADTTPVVFTFSNPDFVDRVTGTTPESKDYKKMSLTGDAGTEFEIALANKEKFHLAGFPYIALQASAASGTSTLLLNETAYALNNVATGAKLVLDMKTGDVYSNGGKVSDLKLSNIDLSRITKLGMEFSANSAEVTYMAFFPSLGEAMNYTGSSALLDETVAALEQKAFQAAYADGKTDSAALAYAKSTIQKQVGDEVSVVSVEKTDFKVATTSEEGFITVQSVIRVGRESDSHYAKVDVTIPFGKKPNAPIVWRFTEQNLEKISGGFNINLSVENGILKASTKDGTIEDGFNITIDAKDMGSDFYLQDYPYIKIKMKGTSSTPTDAGVSSMYIYGDETIGSPSKDIFITNKLNDGKWSSSLINMPDNLCTLANLEDNVMVGSTIMSGSVNMHGKAESIRLDFKRHVTYERTAEVEYIGFFSSKEEAEAYGYDYYYDTHDFNGVEYGVAKEDLNQAPATIESGFKSSKKQAMTIVSNKTSTTDNTYLALETTADGNVRFVYAGQEVLKSTNLDVCDGAWHHAAVTLEAGNAVLYVDGVSVATKDDFAIDKSLSLKAPVIANDYVDEKPFIGSIYYVRIYNTPKTVAQVNANAFNKNSEDKEGLLVGWFTGDLSAERQFVDVCGQNPMNLTDNYGKTGHEFLGSDYIKTTKELAAAPKTFEFWMKTAATSGTHTILSNKSDTNTDYYVAIDLVDGQLQMTYGGVKLFTTDGLTLADNIWRHIAVTLDGTEKVCLYVDGTFVDSYTVTYPSTAPVQAMYYIGSGLETDNTPFVGHLADVRMWSDEKSADTIANNMKEYPEQNAENLLGSWRLDTQIYLEYTDYSSNENTGTLYSTGWYKLDSIHGDYTIVQIGDTQSYTTISEDITIQPDPTKFISMYEGLSDNIERFNIVQLLHAGDITQNATPIEFDYAEQAHAFLEGKIPYTVVPGNHDYYSPSTGMGAEFRDLTEFNDAFSYDEMVAQYAFDNEKFKSEFGGAFEEGRTENMYSFLTVGNVEYMIFGLETGPRDEVLKWVSDVLTTYPKKRAIITTHVYMTGTGEVMDPTSSAAAQNYAQEFADANDGPEIWDKLLKNHGNIAMITCGHSQNTKLYYNEPTSDCGYKVVELIADHSAMVTGFPSKEGLLTLMSFTEDGKMHTYWYSPLVDAFYATENEATIDLSESLYHEYVVGDANGDETISVKDIVRLKKDMKDEKPATGGNDVNSDTKLSVHDLEKLRAWLLGLRN